MNKCELNKLQEKISYLEDLLMRDLSEHEIEFLENHTVDEFLASLFNIDDTSIETLKNIRKNISDLLFEMAGYSQKELQFADDHNNNYNDSDLSNVSERSDFDINEDIYGVDQTQDLNHLLELISGAVIDAKDLYMKEIEDSEKKKLFESEAKEIEDRKNKSIELARKEIERLIEVGFDDNEYTKFRGITTPHKESAQIDENAKDCFDFNKDALIEIPSIDSIKIKKALGKKAGKWFYSVPNRIIESAAILTIKDFKTGLINKSRIHEGIDRDILNELIDSGECINEIDLIDLIFNNKFKHKLIDKAKSLMVNEARILLKENVAIKLNCLNSEMLNDLKKELTDEGLKFIVTNNKIKLVYE